MPERNERTSPRIAEIASRVMRGQPITDAELRSLAASALTQSPDRATAVWAAAELERADLE